MYHEEQLTRIASLEEETVPEKEVDQSELTAEFGNRIQQPREDHKKIDLKKAKRNT